MAFTRRQGRCCSRHCSRFMQRVNALARSMHAQPTCSYRTSGGQPHAMHPEMIAELLVAIVEIVAADRLLFACKHLRRQLDPLELCHILVLAPLRFFGCGRFCCARRTGRTASLNAEPPRKSGVAPRPTLALRLEPSAGPSDVKRAWTSPRLLAPGVADTRATDSWRTSALGLSPNSSDAPPKSASTAPPPEPTVCRICFHA